MVASAADAAAEKPIAAVVAPVVAGTTSCASAEKDTAVVVVEMAAVQPRERGETGAVNDRWWRE